MKILLYLEWRQIANYARVTLRSPKRLIPLLLMLGWMGMSLFPMLMMHHPRPSFPGGGPTMPLKFDLPPTAHAIVFAILAMAMIINAVKSLSSGLIVFGLSDIDFLFPSAVSRRAIMTLKLVGIYTKISVYVIFMTFVMAPQMMAFSRSARPASLIPAFLAAMCFVALVVNVGTVINLIATFRDGRKWWLAYVVHGVAWAFFIGIAAGIAILILRTGNIAESVLRVILHPVVLTILIPAKWTADLLLSLFSGWTPVYWAELAMMFLLAGVSYVLVMLRDENPYEPALAVSLKVAATRSAMLAGGFARVQTEAWKDKQKTKKARTAIPPFGRGAMAIVWKNLNISMRTSGSALVSIPLIVGAILIGTKIGFPGDHRAAVEGVSGFLLGYLLLFSTMFMLQAFRADLKQANLLKPMPFPAWQIVAGQCTHGVIITTALVWSIIALIAVTHGLRPGSFLPPAALALPFVVYAQLAWQSAAAVIYPKIDDPTQQYLAQLISAVAGLIALGAPVGAGVGAWFLFKSLIAVALVVAMTSAGMAIAGVAVSARIYARFDPSDE